MDDKKILRHGPVLVECCLQGGKLCIEVNFDPDIAIKNTFKTDKPKNKEFKKEV